MVDFAVSLNDSHRVSLDMIQLFPADAVEGYFDPEVIKAAKEMNVSLVRWGGNFILLGAARVAKIGVAVYGARKACYRFA